MPAISMNAVQILPELLRFFRTQGNEGKCQTIRPAWSEWIETIAGNRVVMYGRKPPAYKEGDVCKVYWKQRTSPKGSWFCSDCGNAVKLDQGQDGYKTPERMTYVICDYCDRCRGANWDVVEKSGIIFPKLMGEVRITEVIKIEMRKEDKELNPFVVWHNGKYLSGAELLHLVESDGFECPMYNISKFWEFFNKIYDLSTPKPFWVYRYQYHDAT